MSCQATGSEDYISERGNLSNFSYEYSRSLLSCELKQLRQQLQPQSVMLQARFKPLSFPCQTSHSCFFF